MKMRNGFEKRADGCRSDFQKRMSEAHRGHTRTFRLIAALCVVWFVICASLLSFGIWLIITLLQHFSVL